MQTAGLSLNGASKAKAVFKKSNSCPKHPPVASLLTRAEGQGTCVMSRALLIPCHLSASCCPSSPHSRYWGLPLLLYNPTPLPGEILLTGFTLNAASSEDVCVSSPQTHCHHLARYPRTHHCRLLHYALFMSFPRLHPLIQVWVHSGHLACCWNCLGSNKSSKELPIECINENIDSQILKP